jgi:uncharacterized membrane protein YcjF (UPF0283 family)
MLAETSFGEVLLWTLSFFFLFMFLIVFFNIIVDLFRDHETSGAAKALWVVVLILIPVLGSLIYLIARGKGMAERSQKQAAAQKAQMDDYVRGVAAETGPADQIDKAKKLLEAGTISQEEFDAIKAKALS